jgi:radical SAM protein with 4Fe4S-binding SPASM domain
MAVSMYDGPHQIPHFDEMFRAAGIKPKDYILRDRWHNAASDFGLKLTNRAGTIDAGYQRVVDTNNLCFYPAYSMAVDWNGDVLLCVQDWNKRLRFGNLNGQSLFETWQAKALHKRRLKLMQIGRDNEPCSNCNADGCFHGRDHVTKWLSRGGNIGKVPQEACGD